MAFAFSDGKGGYSRGLRENVTCTGHSVDPTLLGINVCSHVGLIYNNTYFKLSYVRFPYTYSLSVFKGKKILVYNAMFVSARKFSGFFLYIYIYIFFLTL